MTPDERNILQAFLSDLANTPAPARDPEADAMIQAAVQQHPGAVYLLVQHAILADQALHAAQAQLQAQQQVQPATSFLPQQASPQSMSPWAGPISRKPDCVDLSDLPKEPNQPRLQALLLAALRRRRSAAVVVGRLRPAGRR